MIINIIYFILVLGITVLIHELGHFIFAKKAGVYIYEFSIGMGPIIFKWKRKNDETDYCIRLFPIGGFVSMAGEDLEEDSKISKEEQLCNKKWSERFLTLIAGILFNFLLALVLLFIVGLINGSPNSKPIIGYIDQNYPIYNTNLKVDDTIVKINNKKVSSSEELVLYLTIYSGKNIDFTVIHKNGNRETVNVKPILTEKDGSEGYSYGFSLDNSKKHGILNAIIYAFRQVKNLVVQMALIIFYLITGKIGINNLSGPVGIFTIVGTAAEAGIISIIYLIAYLCINVGFINLLPFPAFDGGRILFLFIEKIKGSKVNPKVENIIHSVGFILLMILMIFVTGNDILRFFK